MLGETSPVFRPLPGTLEQSHSFPVHFLPDLVGPLAPGMVFAELRPTTTEFDPLEDGGHSIVVLNRDRIELVVVTPGATHRHPEHGSTDGLNDLIHSVGASLSDRCRFAADGCGGNVRSRHKKSCRLTDTKLITGELFFQKLIVRDVVVESADDVVAIDPRVLPIQIRLGPVRLRPADYVEPVLRPALSEVRRGHQFVDQFGVGLLGVCRVLFGEGLNSLGCRRQPG